MDKKASALPLETLKNQKSYGSTPDTHIIQIADSESAQEDSCTKKECIEF